MKKTEPMLVFGKFFQWYPRIRQEDIGTDTSNKFIDTLQICNAYCVMMGADFDGDQVTAKAAYTVEANQELQKYMQSKAQFIGMSGLNVRTADKEVIQTLYSLTLVLPDTKLTNPEF